MNIYAVTFSPHDMFLGWLKKWYSNVKPKEKTIINADKARNCKKTTQNVYFLPQNFGD